jgi:alcohol dehydrogenase
MKALVMGLTEFGLRDVHDPVPRKGDALLRIKKAGICGTDLAIVSGSYKIKSPIILGHEIFGVVDSASGERGRFPMDARVTTEINIPCHICEVCKGGLGNHCLNIQTLGISRDGGFAKYLSAPVENLHIIPDCISDEEAVFVEPLAAAIEIMTMTHIPKGAKVALIGTGRLGLLVLQLLRMLEPQVLVAFSHHDSSKGTKLARAFGADVVSSDDLNDDAVRNFTRGTGFDHVIEASGSTGGFELALKLVRPRGTIHVKSTHGLPVNLDITKIAVKEIRIQGSRCGPFDKAIDLLSSGSIRTRELVTARLPLSDYAKAFEYSRSAVHIKVLLEP